MVQLPKLARHDWVAGELAGKVATTDPRLSDARTPLAHGHVVADTTGLQAALDATKVKRFSLTGNLTVDPSGWPTDQVITTIYTQPATGGPHSVTYAGVTLPIKATGSTKVEWAHDGTDWVPRSPVDATTPGVASSDPSALLAVPSVTPSPATITDPGALRHPGWLSRDRATLFNWQGAPNVRWSSDNGATWNQNPNALPAGATQAIRDLGDGEILVAAGTTPGKLYRSSGWSANKSAATFSEVLTLSGSNIYVHNSWGLSVHENIVLVAEYGSKAANANARYVYLSEDYGKTWRTILDIGGTVETHVHGVAYDPWWGRIWVSRGDATDAILYSDDKGETWATVTDYVASTVKNQVTTIIPMAECVLFLSDSAPNGVLRIRRTPDRKTIVGVAYRLNSSNSITHIGQLAYRAAYPGAPVLMSFTNDPAAGYTGPGVLLATTDGFRFWEVWKDSIDYGGAGGLVTALGPTTDGRYLGTLNDGRQAGYSLLSVTAPTWSVPTEQRRYDAVGDETMPRLSANAEPVPITGTMVLSYLRATQTLDVTLIRAYTGATAAAATTTLFRLGLYEVLADGGLALVAAGVSDVTKIQTAWTSVGQSIAGRIVAGRTYAVAVLAVGPGQMPTLAGTTSAAGVRLSSGVFFMDPKLSAQVPGLGDLPTTVAAASLAPCARIIWHALT